MEEKQIKRAEFDEAISCETNFQWEDYQDLSNDEEIVTDTVRSLKISVEKPEGGLEIREPFQQGELEKIFNAKDAKALIRVMARELEMDESSSLLSKLLERPGIFAISEAPYHHISVDLLNQNTLTEESPFYLQQSEVPNNNLLVLHKMESGEIKATRYMKLRFAKFGLDSDVHMSYENSIILKHAKQEKDDWYEYKRITTVRPHLSETLLEQMQSEPKMKEYFYISKILPETTRTAINKTAVTAIITETVTAAIKKSEFPESILRFEQKEKKSAEKEARNSQQAKEEIENFFAKLMPILCNMSSKQRKEVMPTIWDAAHPPDKKNDDYLKSGIFGVGKSGQLIKKSQSSPDFNAYKSSFNRNRPFR